jgi:predicted small secreted protein
MTRMFALAFTGLSAVALCGCNTLQGAGQDLERAGEELEDATE